MQFGQIESVGSGVDDVVEQVGARRGEAQRGGGDSQPSDDDRFEEFPGDEGRAKEMLLPQQVRAGGPHQTPGDRARPETVLWG